MIDEPGHVPTSAQRGTATAASDWPSHWLAAGQAWRTEPEIDVERQLHLDGRRGARPDVERGLYPFKDVDPPLSRADIEWLLATHEDGRGPVDWSDEAQRGRSGLDLRGADLSGLDLSGLPLACALGALGPLDAFAVPDDRRRMAAVRLHSANLRGTGLEGADLAEADLRGADLAGTRLVRTRLWRAQLGGAHVSDVHLEGADLAELHLEGADLAELHLEGADLREADLEGARLFNVTLEGASLSGAHLERAYLARLHLEGADLSGAHLEEADLSGAHLEGADLRAAHLERADLSGAHLEGAHLSSDALERVRRWAPAFPATLPPARLERAFFDAATNLDHVILGTDELGFVSVADARWEGVNLAVVDWSSGAGRSRLRRRRPVMLGDERESRQARDVAGEPKSADRRVAEYETAARANRQLAIALHNQGLREDGDRFAYRALLVDRLVRRWRRRFGAYLFSLFLDGVAGYGYRMQRILLTYVLAVTLFAVAFYVVSLGTPSPMPLPDAFYTSIISFHGRTFAGPVTLGTVGAWLSAGEAITGLVVEGVFIAMLAQRAFGK